MSSDFVRWCRCSAFSRMEAGEGPGRRMRALFLAMEYSPRTRRTTGTAASRGLVMQRDSNQEIPT
jgi:hypothetical protein